MLNILPLIDISKLPKAVQSGEYYHLLSGRNRTRRVVLRLGKVVHGEFVTRDFNNVI